MKRTIICLTILFPIVAFAATRTAEMTLHAAKMPVPAKEYMLLPKTDESIDADAAPLYEKAFQSLPNDLQMEKINSWLKMPLDELPRKEIQANLEKLEPTFKLLKQAANCKQCRWLYLFDDEITENLRRHRELIFILALKIRFQIAQDRYDDVIETVQIGFAMAKHLGRDSAQQRGLIGISIAAYTCRQLEEFIQRSDTPNLYQALRDLPQPFIDLSRQVEWADPKTKKTVHSLMNRLDRHIAVLQCIEAMRLDAAWKNGAFPNRLIDITRTPVPYDPITRKPFIYNRIDSKAILEIPATGEETDRDTMRYELSLKE